MEQIPLNEALICVNCNTIFRMGRGRCDCPHCAGAQIAAIDGWLNPYKRTAANRPATPQPAEARIATAFFAIRG